MARSKVIRKHSSSTGRISVPVFVFSDAEPREDLIPIGANPQANELGSRGDPLRMRARSQDSERSLSLGPSFARPLRSSSSSSATHSEVSTSGEIIVGMAIGGPVIDHFLPDDQGEYNHYFSPDDVSAFSMSSVTLPRPVPSAFHSTPYEPEETSVPVSQTQHPRKARWKTFFRKNSTVSMSSQPSDDDLYGSLSANSTALPQKPDTSSWSRTKHQTKYPTKSSTKTSPSLLTRSQSTVVPQSPATPVPPPKDAWNEKKLGMLQVNFPDVTMERYSVMFGNVLGQAGQPSVMYHRRAATTNLVPGRQKEVVCGASIGRMVLLTCIDCRRFSKRSYSEPDAASFHQDFLFALSSYSRLPFSPRTSFAQRTWHSAQGDCLFSTHPRSKPARFR